MRLLHVFPSTWDVEEIMDSDDQGLAHSYLVRYVEDRADFPVEYRIINGDIDAIMDDYRPDIVAITGMTYNFENAIKVAVHAKQIGAKTIVGGHHLTIMPDRIKDCMDIGVLGEGEETYLELLRLYNQGKMEPRYLKNVAGIVFRDEDNSLCITPNRSPIDDLDSLGHPNREAAPSTRSTREAILTSRGCPYKCVFCSQAQFWEGMRFHSPEYVIEEIERIHRIGGTKNIRIDDGVFLINKRRLLKILELWEKHPLYGKIKFNCWSRANLMNDEMADIAVRMGIDTVLFGIESNNPESLAYLKGTTVTTEDNQRAYDVLVKRGIRMHASFIIGAPEETEEQIMDTYDFLKRNPLMTAFINHLVPMPGTPVWEYALKRGLVSNDMDFRLLGGQQLGDDAIFVSEKLGREDILRLYNKFHKLMKERETRLHLIRFLRVVRKQPWLAPAKAYRYACRKLSGSAGDSVH